MPDQPQAYLNGELLPISEARLPVSDMGIVHGASVTEMTRTFRHTCFRLEDHVGRLFRSLKYVGFEVDLSHDALIELSEQIVEYNAKLIPATHELGVIQFVTAGPNPTYTGRRNATDRPQPTVCIHTFPLAFELWADKYQSGQHLITPSVRHVPAECVDPKVKSRSRLHWYLADRAARLVDPAAAALVLDRDGNITETSSANFFIVTGGTIVTPPRHRILNGVSRQVVIELAAKLGIELRERDLQPYHAINADEAFTSSTPSCLLPVTRINEHTIGDGTPGPVFRRLLNAWNELVGLDIAEQAIATARDRLTEHDSVD